MFFIKPHKIGTLVKIKILNDIGIVLAELPEGSLVPQEHRRDIFRYELFLNSHYNIVYFNFGKVLVSSDALIIVEN